MRIILLASLFWMLHITSAKAQYMLMFEKTFSHFTGTEAQAIEPVGTSGYIMCGTVLTNGVYNAGLIRLDSAGNILWTKRFGQTTDVFAIDVKPTSTGGFILAVQQAATFSTYDVGGICTDASGNILWEKIWGGIGSEEVYEVMQTSDGGFLFSGRSDSFGPIGAMLIKTDATGTLMWRNVYHGNPGAEGCSAKEVPAGGYVLTSRLLDTTFSPLSHVMVVRTDVNGDTLWTSTFGAPVNGQEEPEDIEVCADGSFLIAGRTYNYTAGITDIFLAKVDPNGNFLWAKVYGGPGTELTFDTDLTSDGGAIVGGWTSSFGNGINNYYLIRTDSMGDTLWTGTTGTTGGDFIFSICQTPDGGFIAAGSSYPTPTAAYLMYVIKTNGAGLTGCNKIGTPTVVSVAPFQESHLPVDYYSGNLAVNSPFTPSTFTMTTSYYCSNVGIEEPAAASSIVLSPNPANGFIMLTSETMLHNTTISVMNALGEVVYCQTGFNGLQTSISTAGFANGTYVVMIESEESTSTHKILVKQ
jgi:hypothetical protein